MLAALVFLRKRLKLLAEGMHFSTSSLGKLIGDTNARGCVAGCQSSRVAQSGETCGLENNAETAYEGANRLQRDTC